MNIGAIGGGASHIWNNTLKPDMCAGLFEGSKEEDEEFLDECESDLAYHKSKMSQWYNGPTYRGGCAVSSSVF